MYQNYFQNKQILITGGTGSIGSSILQELLPFKPKSIKVYSRDEYKQYQLKFKYQKIKNVKIDYLLGDIRDYDSLIAASENVDILYHCAAYKHVPQSEKMPEEFIKTNVYGSINVKRAALVNKIKTVVSISSDKAVEPTNVMGLTKALQEKLFNAHYFNSQTIKQRFINVRFGNVIGTKGSLFPILYHQIVNKLPLTITDSDMTRFFMTQKQAIDLIFWATINAKDGDTVIKKIKSAKLSLLIRLFLQVSKMDKNYPKQTIGMRVGEKMHESLINQDEIFRIKELGIFYLIKPYSSKEIQQNILKVNPEDQASLLDKFSSRNSQNYFKSEELLLLINQYIQTVKNNNQIL